MADVANPHDDPEWGSPGFWPHPLRGRPRWLVALVVVLLVAGATAAVWGIRTALAGPQAEVGEFLSDSTAEGVTNEVTVRLPWGNLQVSAGEAAERIPDTVLYSRKFEANYHEIEAPDDGSWVTLKIEPDIDFGGTLFRSSSDAKIPATTISVLAGGRTIPLARANGGGKPSSAQVFSTLFAPTFEGYLALPDRPDDLHLRIDFDGVRQDAYVNSSRVTSRQAAPLYADDEEKNLAVECSRPTVPGYRIGYLVKGTCTLSRLLHLPYVAGLGWAKPGRSWLVTTVRIFAPPQMFRTAPSGRRGTYYSDVRDEVASTLSYGTIEPRSQAPFNRVHGSIFVDPDNPRQFVFDVPADDDGSDTFTLMNRYDATLGESVPGLPREVTLTSTRTIAVPVS